jgi:hypothetical protein
MLIIHAFGITRRILNYYYFLLKEIWRAQQRKLKTPPTLKLQKTEDGTMPPPLQNPTQKHI